MSSADATEPKVEETKAAESKPTSSAVFSMFGGGPKREMKPDEEPSDKSGSAKAQRDAAAAAAAEKKGDDEAKVEESEDIHFEPVIKLTQQVETNTNEDAEELLYQNPDAAYKDDKTEYRAKMYRYVLDAKDWKERGTGQVRLLKHKETGKIRIVMRRDKTLKVCANHYIPYTFEKNEETGEVNPIIQSNGAKAWVWMAAADVSEGEPEQLTVAMKFGSIEIADHFKKWFIVASDKNKELFVAATGGEGAEDDDDEEEEEKEEEKKEAEEAK